MHARLRVKKEEEFLGGGAERVNLIKMLKVLGPCIVSKKKERGMWVR
jgi:hypothetical protein